MRQGKKTGRFRKVLVHSVMLRDKAVYRPALVGARPATIGPDAEIQARGDPGAARPRASPAMPGDWARPNQTST